MNKQEIMKLASEIHQMHSNLYEDSICFRSFADPYDSQEFMMVHNHSGSWSIGFSPTRMFEDGAMEIQSDGRIELTILSDHSTAWTLAMEALKERHAIITRLFREVDLIAKQKERESKIQELESELNRLKSNTNSI